MRWAGRQEEKGKRQKEEAEQLLLAEAALSTLARVERAPELGADLRRRITGTRVGGLRWGWVGAGAAAMIMIVVAVAVWPRGEGEGMRSGRRECPRMSGLYLPQRAGHDAAGMQTRPLPFDRAQRRPTAQRSPRGRGSHRSRSKPPSPRPLPNGSRPRSR